MTITIDVAEAKLIQANRVSQQAHDTFIEAGIEPTNCLLRLGADNDGKLHTAELIIKTAEGKATIVLTDIEHDGLATVTNWTAQDWALSTLRLTPDNQLQIGASGYYLKTKRLNASQLKQFKAIVV